MRYLFEWEVIILTCFEPEYVYVKKQKTKVITLTLCPSSLCCLVCVCWQETCGNKALENIASHDQKLEIEAYAEKLAVIKEVLARRHMKVAFFGRYKHRY